MAVSDNVIHSGTAPDTTLASNISGVDTSMTLTSGSGYPSPTGGQKAYIVLDPGTAAEELISYTSRSGNSISGMTRGLGGTSASSHSSGGVDTVRHQWTSVEADDTTKATLNTLGRVTAANQLLLSDTSTTLAALDVAASRIVGRAAAGNVDDLTAAQVKTILAILAADISDFAETVRDTIGSALVAGSNMTVTVNDAGDTITLASSGLAAFRGARVYPSAVQSIGSGASTVLNFDSETFDTNTLHDNVTNNSRVVLDTAGYWRVNGSIGFASNATGRRAASIYLNGAATEKGFAMIEAGSTGIVVVQVSTIVKTTVTTDYVQLLADQDSGGSLNTAINGDSRTYFETQYLGA